MSTSRTPKFSKRLKAISEIISAILVIGGAVVGAVTWINGRIQATLEERFDSIDSKLATAELDSARTQLLVLMNDYPNNESEILKVAHHYFNDLDGDWYMSELFSKWAEERGIDISHIMVIKGRNKE